MATLKTNGIELYYETYGNGYPMVFVSGFSCDHTGWQNVIADIAKNFQVIVFDNRGMGKSSCPNYPYTTEIMAEDVVGLIKTLKLHKPYLVGHSFGCCIAQTVMKNYPDLIKAAALVNSPAKLNIRAKIYIETRLELMQANAPETSIIKFISMLCYSDKYLKQPDMVEKLVASGFFPISIQSYINQANAALTFDPEPWLHTVQTPCLVIGSDDDLLVTAQETKQIANTIPNGKYYCFKNVGHVPMAEKPTEFVELFIASKIFP